MTHMTSRDWLIVAALAALPLLILMGYIFEIHLGLWMGGWFVVSLAYLVFFENAVSYLRTKNRKHD